MANESSEDQCNNASDEELLQPTFGVDRSKDPIFIYRQQTLNENAPPMRTYVNRMNEEFMADVLAIYKKPNPELNSTLRVKFENEVAVGEGPVREFFSTLMGFLHDGFPLDGADRGKLTKVLKARKSTNFLSPMLSFVMQDFIQVLAE